MYLPEGPHDIVPTGGAFVCFVAEQFEHEVLPSARERLAVSGWFRRRPLLKGAALAESPLTRMLESIRSIEAPSLRWPISRRTSCRPLPW